MDQNSKKNVMCSLLNRCYSWFCMFILLAYIPSVTAGEYVLGGGDIVQIIVYEQSDLSLDVRISRDSGTISYPLLGEVKIGGLTPTAAGQKIATLLRQGGFIHAPQVTLNVKEYHSQQIPVMGQVNNPGDYKLNRESRVIDLIAEAGGLKDNAADIIIVVKQENGKQIKHTIDLMRFYAGDMSQNIQVARGDFILVPKMDAFYIHGEVHRPGMYRLERGMTVMQALSVGGGLNDRGSHRGMKVTRVMPGGKTEKLDVELSDALQPNDVLYIKERLF